ncbi:tautomerase family protein [Pseudorhodoplanes sp.]|uniref:tautomerase family protein n=1 Tax=Pseudorhodoplanes sp. TaxID=1934341 RepID=UPI003D0FADF6
MPFVELSLRRGKSVEEIKKISDAIHQALVDAYEMPDSDRFQIIHQLEPHELVFDRHHMGGPRTDGFMVLSITAGKERTIEVKKAFFNRLAQLLSERAGVDLEDIFVMLKTLTLSDFSFGGGRSLIPD